MPLLLKVVLHFQNNYAFGQNISISEYQSTDQFIWKIEPNLRNYTDKPW
jgi:hypothetical protein